MDDGLRTLRHADCELALFFISCGCKYTNPVNHHMGNCFLDLTVANGAKNELQPTCLIITSLPVCFRPSYSSLFQLMDKKMSCQRMSFAYIYEWIRPKKVVNSAIVYLLQKNIFQINLHCPLSGFSMCFHSICFHGRAEIEEHDRPFHICSIPVQRKNVLVNWTLIKQ